MSQQKGTQGALKVSDDDGERKKVEYYKPPRLTSGKELLNERKALHLNTGGNFDELLGAVLKVTGREAPKSVKKFQEMKLNPVILDALKSRGHFKPTPVQEGAIPVLLAERDVMACSQTGSGKMAAYVLPIVHKLMSGDLPKNKMLPATPQALILVPVRELTIQIAKEFLMYSISELDICFAYGGTARRDELQRLKTGCNVLIATPGRLIELLEEESVQLKQLRYFVLDEADRMLDMGFKPDVKRIASHMPASKNRVTAMFSATFPPVVQKAANNFLCDYIFVTVGTIGGACGDVEQVFHVVERAEKRHKLLEVLRGINPMDKVLIFCSQRDGVDILSSAMSEQGYSCIVIHGERTQKEREISLKKFTQGTSKILIATSVAARGLDIPNVTLVVNYDLPQDISDYVQRIGRTGRVGHAGKSISFFEYHTDAPLAKSLISTLRDVRQPIPQWMLTIDSQEDSDDDGLAQQFRTVFPSTDIRQSNAIGSARYGVPLPCEDIQDSWD